MVSQDKKPFFFDLSNNVAGTVIKWEDDPGELNIRYPVIIPLGTTILHALIPQKPYRYERGIDKNNIIRIEGSSNGMSGVQNDTVLVWNKDTDIIKKISGDLQEKNAELLKKINSLETQVEQLRLENKDLSSGASKQIANLQEMGKERSSTSRGEEVVRLNRHRPQFDNL